MQEKLIPLLLQANAPDLFMYNGCNFKVQKSKGGTGRVVSFRWKSVWSGGIGGGWEERQKGKRIGQGATEAPGEMSAAGQLQVSCWSAAALASPVGAVWRGSASDKERQRHQARCQLQVSCRSAAGQLLHSHHRWELFGAMWRRSETVASASPVRAVCGRVLGFRVESFGFSRLGQRGG
eukprot:366421-Chlamydomonas_euryale.AAC.16